MLVPITSENQAVGLMEFFSLHPKYFNGDHANMLALITVPFFALLNDKERSLILFRNLQVPIDVDTDKSEFYQDVISLIEEASGVQKIVLRRFDSAHGRLKCLAQYGFEGTDVTTDLDFPSIPELFKDVIETGKRRIIRDIRSEVDGDQIANSLIYRDVLSCAIFPLRVGNSLLGTLSFALDFPYNFTNLEVEGFESIANSVAIAISNYESLLKSRRLRNQAIDVARLQFRVDVGHAFRHAARYDLDRAQLQLALIETEIKKRLYNKAIERINLASGSLHAISSHLDRLKQAVHDSVPTKSIVNVKALLEDAFFVMGEVLKAEEISWKIEIPNVEISTKPQILKEILCNLILNSRDAFRSNKVRQNKRIAVFMDKLSSSDKSLRMRFTDNAGGITVSKLRSPGKRPVSSVQDIFKPGITSKDEGSGYGMYLVRDFLGDLDGSIEIVDYRNGVTFAITLPV